MKDTEEYRKAKLRAVELATAAGYPAVIRHWPASGVYRVELIQLENDGPEFEIVQPNKKGPDGPERTMS